jgi:hypothetical protein
MDSSAEAPALVGGLSPFECERAGLESTYRGLETDGIIRLSRLVI